MDDPGPQSIAVDAMGSDKGPSEIIAGVAIALKEAKNLGQVRLVGNEDLLKKELKSVNLDQDERIQIVHASEVIGMDEKAVQSLKRKKDASLVRAIEQVKAGKSKAAVSCGNTGSLVACGTLRLRTLPGVERPALGSVWPGRKQPFVMLDVGANPEAKPDHLVQNAILGSHYCRILLKRPRPRIGLLSNGTEEGKGNERIQETHEKLKSLGDLINYKGPIEGFQIFDDTVDVVVCDGFSGNLLLKTSESLFHYIKDYAVTECRKNPLAIIGLLMARSTLRKVRDKISPDQFGGAPLLGLQGTVLKSHGSSNRKAVAAAIRIACRFVSYDMNAHALEDIQAANAILKPKMAQV